MFETEKAGKCNGSQARTISSETPLYRLETQMVENPTEICTLAKCLTVPRVNKEVAVVS